MRHTPTVSRGRSRWIWLIALAAVIVIPVAWYLISPLFLSKTVQEEFPMSAGAELPEGMTQQQAETEMMAASKVTNPATDVMPGGAPIAVVRGSFGEVDRVHKGEGNATVYRIGDRLVLRLDPFTVTNGPDLYVYLSGHAVPRSSEQLHQNGALELGRLKGNIGSQNYDLPADVNLSAFKSAVIYCRRFRVIFSTAELVPSSK